MKQTNSGPSLGSEAIVHHVSTPTKQETWFQYLGWEDPLEKEMATLLGESHAQTSLVGYRPWGAESDVTQTLNNKAGTSEGLNVIG